MGASDFSDLGKGLGFWFGLVAAVPLLALLLLLGHGWWSLLAIPCAPITGFIIGTMFDKFV